MGNVYLKNKFVWQETPTPATDGAETAFIVAAAYVPGSLRIYRDQYVMFKDIDYTEEAVAAPTGFTMTSAPDADEAVRVDYMKP